jgi:hypothetical protein
MVADRGGHRRPVRPPGRPDPARRGLADPARGAGAGSDRAATGRSWDITDLRTPWRGLAFQAAFGEHGIPGAVHADSGPAMRSTVLGDFLADM